MAMYKSKLQELCQGRSWNLPEYNTVKDGPDHIPRFTAVVLVNGQNFETPGHCKSSKDAQNTAARIAFEYFNGPQQPRVHHQVSLSSVASYVIPPLDRVATVAEMHTVPVPAASHPSALPVPPPRFLAPKNNEHVKPVNKEMTQQNCDTAQNSKIYTTPIGSHDVLHMYKNRLQQYVQKKNLGLPVYTCESEGPPHARRFKSRVQFDGKSYETLEFFHTLKEAEHAAAKIACQMLPVDEIEEDGGLYKNLLQELAQKKGYLCPSYETVRSGLSHMPIFASTVEIGSNTFRGNEAKSKKQAEMNAAKVAYHALTQVSLVEPSNGPSSMGFAVANNLTKNILPAETIKRDKHAAIEAAGINSKRAKSFSETANLLPPPSSGSCDASSASAQVNSTVNNPLSVQQVDPESKFSSKTVVIPRNSNPPIPEGATLMPCSDNQWVSYKVELNQEHTT